MLGCVLLCTHEGARKQVQSVRAPLIRLSKQTGNGENRMHERLELPECSPTFQALTDDWMFLFKIWRLNMLKPS